MRGQALWSPGVMPHPGMRAQSASLRVQCLGSQRSFSPGPRTGTCVHRASWAVGDWPRQHPDLDAAGMWAPGTGGGGLPHLQIHRGPARSPGVLRWTASASRPSCLEG